MKMQTPKNQQKKSPYTSPIGLLKNYNTVSGTNNSGSYEQQFYRIKAHRLQAQLDQLKQENTILKAKLTDSTAANQILKQKVFVMENSFDRADRTFTQRTLPSFISDSGYPSRTNSGRQSPSRESKYYSITTPNQKSQRSIHSAEIQRLIKQNRVLKNQHQLRMNELQDQNKKLSRKILQLETNLTSKINENKAESSQKQEKEKLSQKYNKLERTVNELRNANDELQKQKTQLQQKSKVLDESNKSLRRQNQQLRVLNSSKNRAQSVINDLKDQIKTRQDQHKQQVERLSKQIENLKKSRSIQTITPSNVLAEKQVNKRSQKINAQTQIPKSSNQNVRSDREVELLKRKIALQQQSLQDKDEQIKNMLIKLKPLMQKQKNTSKAENQAPVGDSKRASLSLLQVFLKKYKINSF